MLLYFINIEYNAIGINNYYYNLLVCFNYIYDYLDILVHIELLYIKCCYSIYYTEKNTL